MISFATHSWPRPSALFRVTPRMRAPRWVLWSPNPTGTRCSLTSNRRRLKGQQCSVAVRQRLHPTTAAPTGTSCSPPFWKGSDRSAASTKKKSSDRSSRFSGLRQRQRPLNWPTIVPMVWPPPSGLKTLQKHTVWPVKSKAESPGSIAGSCATSEHPLEGSSQAA